MSFMFMYHECEPNYGAAEVQLVSNDFRKSPFGAV